MTVLRPQLAYAIRDHPATVFQFLNYRLDQLLVAGYVGVRGLGLYTVAVTLSELLWVIPDSVATVVFPYAAKRQPGNDSSTRRAFAFSTATTFLGAIGLALIGHQVIRLLFGEPFNESYGVLLWLLPGATLLGPAKILTSELAGRGYPLINSIGGAIGLAATVILNAMLIPRYGIKGAAIASTVSYIIVAVVALLAFLRLRHRGDASQNQTTT
jgi:O-antigen/teichoic acid export membrane protein